MYVVFFSTSDVFATEEILTSKNVRCKIVPTPATDRAHCGVCIEIDGNLNLDDISEFEYEIITEV